RHGQQAQHAGIDAEERAIEKVDRDREQYGAQAGKHADDNRQRHEDVTLAQLEAIEHRLDALPHDCPTPWCAAMDCSARITTLSASHTAAARSATAVTVANPASTDSSRARTRERAVRAAASSATSASTSAHPGSPRSQRAARHASSSVARRPAAVATRR